MRMFKMHVPVISFSALYIVIKCVLKYFIEHWCALFIYSKNKESQLFSMSNYYVLGTLLSDLNMLTHLILITTLLYFKPEKSKFQTGEIT